jgi:quercetin dioxygenase-like cupin family protein
MPTTYRIDVRGHLPAACASEFARMTASVGDGLTTLIGPIPDAAALYGLIARLESLGLALVAVTPVPDRPSTHDRGGAMEHALAGWDIGAVDDQEWVAWGSTNNARAKVLAVADGYHVVLVEAEAGYSSEAHLHDFPEFLYVIDGSLRTQGQLMTRGDAYAASAGSAHTDFATETGATYVSIFRLS